MKNYEVWDGLPGLLGAGQAWANAKRLKAPPELWHAVIFYCVGEVMRKNVPGYEPYADEQKLWQREWPGLLPVLEATFKEYIGGKGTLMSAVNGLVVGL